MSTRPLVVSLALLGSLLVPITFFVPDAHAATTIEITAVPSKFTPNTITLHVGETTRLDFNHIEGVHGIESTDLGIAKTVLMDGQDVTLDVTPQKAGTYVLHCQIDCGPEHKNMTLTINVE